MHHLVRLVQNASGSEVSGIKGKWRTSGLSLLKLQAYQFWTLEMEEIHDINHDTTWAPWCHCSGRIHHRHVNCFANPWSVKVLCKSGHGRCKRRVQHETNLIAHQADTMIHKNIVSWFQYNIHVQCTYILALYLKSNHLPTSAQTCFIFSQIYSFHHKP